MQHVIQTIVTNASTLREATYGCFNTFSFDAFSFDAFLSNQCHIYSPSPSPFCSPCSSCRVPALREKLFIYLFIYLFIHSFIYFAHLVAPVGCQHSERSYVQTPPLIVWFLAAPLHSAHDAPHRGSLVVRCTTQHSTAHD